MLSAIFIVVLSLLFTFTKRSTVSQSLGALEYYAGRPSSEIVTDKTNSLFGSRSSEYSNYNIFILEYSTAFNQIKVYGTDDDISDERKVYLVGLFNATMEKPDGIGIVEQYNMRYRRTYQLGKIKIVYLDKTYEDCLMQDFTVRTAIIGGIGWLAFFGITLIIAHIALKPVERSWEQQQRLVADVSHELKTPLTSIKGFTDMLASGMVVSQEDQKRFLTMISVEVDRLIDLINDILKLSELESVAIAQGEETSDALDAANEVAAFLAPVAEKAGVALSVSGEHVSAAIPYDRLKELLLNLMENGIKYNEPGGTVTASLEKENEMVRITVADTGIGIPEESCSRVFERFYRVDKGRARKNGGTGLGLAIVKHIVVLYGGRMALQSELGKGSTFTVCLPKAG